MTVNDTCAQHDCRCPGAHRHAAGSPRLHASVTGRLRLLSTTVLAYGERRADLADWDRAPTGLQPSADFPYLAPPRWGWTNGPDVWHRVNSGQPPVRATLGNTDRAAHAPCLDCDT